VNAIAGQPRVDVCRTSGRGGFTLIEILITTVLTATLLAVLWGLFGVYSGLFEKGQAQVSQAQSARAILQQLAEDLHAAIEDGPGDRPSDDWAVLSGDVAFVRRFGLLGTRDTLQIDVLAVVPAEDGLRLDADVTTAGQGALQVPELRTIYYTFVAEDAGVDSADLALPPEAGPTGSNQEASNQPGLTRLELDFETPYGNDNAASFDGEPTSDTAFSAEDDSVLRMPEVVRLEFRYFDGSGWSDTWDSLQRGSLPVAVEVTLQVKPFEEPDAVVDVAPQPEQTELDAEGLDAVDATTSQSDTAHLPVHRLVIDLPGSRQYAPSQPWQPVASEPSPRLPTPLVAPRLSVGRRPDRPDASTAIPADQWIREEP